MQRGIVTILQYPQMLGRHANIDMTAYQMMGLELHHAYVHLMGKNLDTVIY